MATALPRGMFILIADEMASELVPPRRFGGKLFPSALRSVVDWRMALSWKKKWFWIKLKLRTRKQQTLKMVPILGNDACRWFECFNVMLRGWLTHYYYSAFEDGTLPIAIRSYWIMHGVAQCIIISWHAYETSELEAYQYQGVSEICWAIWRDFLPNTVLESSQCVGCTPRNWALTRSDDGQIKRYKIRTPCPSIIRS